MKSNTHFYNVFGIRCDLFGCEEVAVELLSAVHSLGYIEDIQSLSSKDQQTRDLMASEHCEQGDIYYSEGSDTAAFLAAGGAIKVIYFPYGSIYYSKLLMY